MMLLSDEGPTQYNGQTSTVGAVKRRCEQLETLMNKVYNVAREHVTEEADKPSDYCFDAAGDRKHSVDVHNVERVTQKWHEHTQTLKNKQQQLDKRVDKLQERAHKQQDMINKLQLSSYTKDRSIGHLKTQLAQLSSDEYNKACNMLAAFKVECGNVNAHDHAIHNQMHCVSYVVDEQEQYSMISMKGDGDAPGCTTQSRRRQSSDGMLSSMFGVKEKDMLRHIP